MTQASRHGAKDQSTNIYSLLGEQTLRLDLEFTSEINKNFRKINNERITVLV